MAKPGRVIKKHDRDSVSRPIRWRKYPHIFLIVCEDQKVEPAYFDTFLSQYTDQKIYIRTVGTGRSSLGVVTKAIEERSKLEAECKRTVDEVWSVFDKDDADKSKGNIFRFTEAFRVAKTNDIKLAYSNEVFELWLLLHFIGVSADQPLPRASIYDLLEKEIKKQPGQEEYVYKHGDPEIIDLVLCFGNELDATARSEALFKMFKTKNTLPIDANPSTTVFILSRRLRELAEWYSYQN